MQKIELEYNDNLEGFIATLENGKIVQIQYELETNKLHADYHTFYPVIDKENDYGFNLSDDEEEAFIKWMKEDKLIKNAGKMLDKELAKKLRLEQKLA